MARKKRKFISVPGKLLKYKPEYCKQAYTACSLFGARDIDLAKLFGVKVLTVKRWKKSKSRFGNAVRKGKDEYDTANVEKSVLKRALGFTYDEVSTQDILLKKGKKGKGKKRVVLPATKVKVTTKEVVPDVQAQIFWLTNRNRERWKDIKDKNVDVKGGVAAGVLQVPFMPDEKQWLEQAEKYRKSVDSILMERNSDGTFEKKEIPDTTIQRS